MGRCLLVCLIAILTTLAGSVGRCAEPALQTVSTDAQSKVSFDAATQDALRDAVRQVVGALIAGETRAEMVGLARAAICSRAAGYVRSHKINKQPLGADKMHRVTVEAVVDKGKVKSDLAAVLNLARLTGGLRFGVEVSGAAVAGWEADKGALRIWIEGAANRALLARGLAVVHSASRNDTLEREYKSAVAAGKAKRALQLKLMMVAPYTVRVSAKGKSGKETAYGVPTHSAEVELQLTAVRAAGGEALGSQSGAGKANSTLAVPVREAVELAVAKALPGVLDRMLSDWMKLVDVARPLTVQVADTPGQQVDDLATKMAALPEVQRLTVLQVPELKVAEVRVVASLTSERLVERLSDLLGEGFEVAAGGPDTVTVRSAKAANRPGPDQTPDLPLPPDPSLTASTTPAGLPPAPAAPEPVAQTTEPGSVTSSMLTLAVVGIIIIAVVLLLRKKKG